MSYEQLVEAVDNLAVSNATLTQGAVATLTASNAAVSTAVAARDVAIQARDAAQLSAGIFDNTTLGLAATTNGKYFSTPSPESIEFLILYKNVAGAAIEIDRYSNANAVKEVVFDVATLVDEIVDSNDAMYRTTSPISDVIPLAGVTNPTGETQIVVGYSMEDGTLKVNGVSVAEAPVVRLLDSSIKDATEDMHSGLGRSGYIPMVGVTDALGNVQAVVEYGVVDKALFVNGQKLSSSGSSTLSTQTILKSLPVALRYLLRDINHIIYYGQSLSNGTVSTPLLSTVSRFSNALSFIPGGPRATLAGSVGLNPGMDALGPLVENDLINDNGTGHARLETPCSSTINGIIERMAREDGTDWRTASAWMGSAAGKGSASIQQLSPGVLSSIDGRPDLGTTEWFQVFRDHVSRGKVLATAQGKTYAVPAVVWMQGEGDNAGIGSEQTYYTALAALRTACNTYVKSVTGQTEDIAWLMYQTYSRTQNVPIPYASSAQRRYARETPLTYIVNPIGRFPRSYDNGHLSGVGSYWFGQYVARSLKRLLVDHLEPTWLEAVSAVSTGRVIKIHYEVPVKPLVLDNTSPQMYVTQDFGFAVKDSIGTLGLVSVVVGVSGDTVEIVVDRDLSTNAVVRYGLDYRGAGEPDYAGSANGNLRDNNTEAFKLKTNTYSTWNTATHAQLSIIPLEDI